MFKSCLECAEHAISSYCKIILTLLVLHYIIFLVSSPGTHVAGTIAAVGGNGKGVVGVMSNGEVGLHIVRVFNDEGRFVWASGLVAAVEECVKAGSNVVNMSLGGGAFLSFENTAYKRILEEDNVLLVAAAGNGGNTAKSFPASYDAIISVAAVDSREQLASFSQRNNQVELAAPGVAVLSTTPGNDYKQYSGTSMACPHVAGVAALVWSSFPEKSAREIRQALQASAKDLGTSGKDNSYGYGLVDAEGAYTYLNRGGVSLSPTAATPTTCNDVSGWENTRGEDCDWFAANEAWRCRWYGGRFEKDGFTGNDACCACGGGNQGGGGEDDDIPTSSPSKTPTAAPIEGGDDNTAEPTFFPSKAPTAAPIEGDACTDSLGWYDSDGDTCEWYAEGGRCARFGNYFQNFGETANQACCVCGGGDSDEDCVDEQGWDHGKNVYNCAWYTESRCSWWGDVFQHNGIFAKDACCVCRD